MTYKIFTELDPVFETMGLLFVSRHFDEMKQETKRSLNDLSTDGEQIYSRNTKTYEKYLQSFLKYRITSPDDEIFFGEWDLNYIHIFMMLINANRNWISSTDDLTDEQVKKQIVQSYKAYFQNNIEINSVESIDDIIRFIEKSGLEGNSKWNLMRIMQQPKKHILQLINSININIEPYKKTVNDIKKPLDKLLGRYNAMIKNPKDNQLNEVTNILKQDGNIYPALVFPFAQVLLDKNNYCGLLSNFLDKDIENHNHSKELLLIRLKALSDKSKLGIIASLKSSPKYSLEIAQLLGLTAATMSHHMAVLLKCGLVGVERKDVKAYYHLNRENIMEMIEELEATLL